MLCFVRTRNAADHEQRQYRGGERGYAAAYAKKVLDQFVPDVLRVDTSVTSNYLTPCGTLDSTPLLCGGRFLNDDVIDVEFEEKK